MELPKPDHIQSAALGFIDDGERLRERIRVRTIHEGGKFVEDTELHVEPFPDAPAIRLGK